MNIMEEIRNKKQEHNKNIQKEMTFNKNKTKWNSIIRNEIDENNNKEDL